MLNMLVLQQISRNVRINSTKVRFISITETRQDDKKSLSDEEKEKIRNKLKSIKERLLKKEQEESEVKQDEPSPVKMQDHESIKEKFQVKLFLKQNARKIGKDEDKQKTMLKSLLEQQIKAEEEGKKDDADEGKNIESKKSFEENKKQREVKKRLEYKKNILNLLEDDKVEEEARKEEDIQKAGEEDKRQKQKGKLRLQQILEESENLQVEEKVEIPRPERTFRPVDKAARKAETNDHVKLLKSIKNVADELGGDVSKTESELMDMVFKSEVSEESERQRLEEPEKSKMTSVLGDLNVDSRQDEGDDPKSELKRTIAMIRDLQRRSGGNGKSDESRGYDYESRSLVFPLFDHKPLKIFDYDYFKNLDEKKLEEAIPVTETYDKIKQKELIKLVTHSPTNIYEEMIKWTKEGKLWHFPIDNEWKYQWEENVDFSEHVLLEHHLEPWCPRGGPIRQFMELVCVGLGKNPFITAEEKREHIYWFKEYFQEKRRLLEDVGAFKTEKKQIEQS